MKKEFYDLAKKIAAWHEQTFPDEDKTGQLLKLDEELNEWDNSDPDNDMEELSDCFIVAASLWNRFNTLIGIILMDHIIEYCADADGELYDAIVAKMEVNKERTKRGVWKKQPNNPYHH